jgi:hypothetical protein
MTVPKKVLHQSEQLDKQLAQFLPIITEELTALNSYPVLFDDYPELRTLWNEWFAIHANKSFNDVHGHREKMPDDIKRMFQVKNEYHRTHVTHGGSKKRVLHLSIIDSKIYTVYDKEIYGDELRKMDFSHIKDWLDIKILQTEVELWSRVPIFYHPDVQASLKEFEEDSPYWGIDYQAITVKHRRLTKTKGLDKPELTFEEHLHLANILPTPDKVRRQNVRRRVKETLIGMGYPKKTAPLLLKEFEENNTPLSLNLEPEIIAKEIDTTIRSRAQ